jgi:hypothetical protein
MKINFESDASGGQGKAPVRKHEKSSFESEWHLIWLGKVRSVELQYQ